jgi:hypothetical protein
MRLNDGDTVASMALVQTSLEADIEEDEATAEPAASE